MKNAVVTTFAVLALFYCIGCSSVGPRTYRLSKYGAPILTAEFSYRSFHVVDYHNGGRLFNRSISLDGVHLADLFFDHGIKQVTEYRDGYTRWMNLKGESIVMLTLDHASKGRIFTEFYNHDSSFGYFILKGQQYGFQKSGRSHIYIKGPESPIPPSPQREKALAFLQELEESNLIPHGGKWNPSYIPESYGLLLNESFTGKNEN